MSVNHDEAREIAEQHADPEEAFVIGDTRSSNNRRLQMHQLAKAYLDLEKRLQDALEPQSHEAKEK